MWRWGADQRQADARGLSPDKVRLTIALFKEARQVLRGCPETKEYNWMDLSRKCHEEGTTEPADRAVWTRVVRWLRLSPEHIGEILMGPHQQAGRDAYVSGVSMRDVEQTKRMVMSLSDGEEIWGPEKGRESNGDELWDTVITHKLRRTRGLVLRATSRTRDKTWLCDLTWGKCAPKLIETVQRGPRRDRGLPRSWACKGLRAGRYHVDEGKGAQGGGQPNRDGLRG